MVFWPLVANLSYLLLAMQALHHAACRYPFAVMMHACRGAMLMLVLHMWYIHLLLSSCSAKAVFFCLRRCAIDVYVADHVAE